MSHPILALRAAIHARLAADAQLASLLGGSRIWDEAPRGAEPPYVTFGEASAKDWSTDSSTGHQHMLSLIAWSRQGGDGEALAIADRIAAVLTDAPLAPVGHAVVLLRIVAQETARPDKAGLRRATLRLSALTEVL